MVDRSELRENDDNLNIRRYADNTPPPEPHDVRAHLYGGVPKAEVEAKAELFAACGLDPIHLFKARDERYLDFRGDLPEKADLAARIEADEGVRACEVALTEAVESWWNENLDKLAQLPETQALMELRAQLLSSFETALRPVGLLDRFQVAGVIATWWGEVEDDLRTLAARGFLGLVGAWETSILAAIEEKGSNEDPFGHRLVRHLLPEYLEQIGDVEAERAALDARLKNATASTDEDDGDANGAEHGEGDSDAISDEELQALKKQFSEAKKRLKGLERGFAERLQAARAELEEISAGDLALAVLRADLEMILERCLADQRGEVVAAFERLWEKYSTTLASIEHQRDKTRSALYSHLDDLGYAR